MTEKAPSSAALARQLLEGGTAALATLEHGGGPFTSHIVVAQEADGSPITLLSRLALHTKNLGRDPRASLLFVQAPAPSTEALTAARLTLTGRFLRCDDPDARKRFLARHPDAARYADFADFSLYRFEVEAGHLVAGFGVIAGLTREDILSPA